MFGGNFKLKVIFLLGFLLSLHLAFTAYINSSFLSQFAGEKSVGLIYILGSATSILALFFIPAIMQRLREYRFMLWSSGLSGLTLLLLSTLKSPAQIILVFIFYFALNTLIVFALDELLQIFSQNSSKGRVRGLYLTIINLAWVLAQSISGKTLELFSFSTVYLVGFGMMVIFWLVAFTSLRGMVDPKYDKVLGWQSFKKFFSNKNLVRSYKLNFLLQFFYAWMVIYTPLYLHAHLGFDWDKIGMIFAIMLMPFVLIQYPLGKHADKFGERGMLMFGFLVASVATLSIFFFKTDSLWLWAGILFLTRVGAAIIEVMSDVYFFKHIKNANDEFISVYRNALPTAYILAPLAAFLVFALTPSFNFLYAVLGAILLSGVYLASTIRKDDI